jgi:hypothetical protein
MAPRPLHPLPPNGILLGARGDRSCGLFRWLLLGPVALSSRAAAPGMTVRLAVQLLSADPALPDTVDVRSRGSADGVVAVSAAPAPRRASAAYTGGQSSGRERPSHHHGQRLRRNVVRHVQLRRERTKIHATSPSIKAMCPLQTVRQPHARSFSGALRDYAILSGH